MITRTCARSLVLVVVALGQLSCAAGSLEPLNNSMPAARAGLRPEFRIFYDTLADYGDWVLINPYGYVFRPRLGFETWRPYSDGFWAPTDSYGWVWVSAEPFGWATYHYGGWLYDDYEGWVWVPGLEWAPAWVTWQSNDQYVGWGPSSPGGGWPSNAPGGAFNYVQTTQLASTNLKSQLVNGSQLPKVSARFETIDNVGHRDGVTFNRGPRFDVVERKIGPLVRARIDDIVPTVAKDGKIVAPGTTVTADTVVVTKRAAEEATQRARAVGSETPSSLPVVRPYGLSKAKIAGPRKAVKAAGESRSGRPAPRDTTR